MIAALALRWSLVTRIWFRISSTVPEASACPGNLCLVAMVFGGVRLIIVIVDYCTVPSYAIL